MSLVDGNRVLFSSNQILADGNQVWADGKQVIADDDQVLTNLWLNFSLMVKEVWWMTSDVCTRVYTKF
jgi:hypothetical protein